MERGATAPDTGPSARVAAAFAALGIVIFTWPTLPRMGSSLLGHPFGEVDNHLWMATFGGRPDAPARNFPVGFDLPLMDPVHLPLWRVAGVFGPVFAYNFVALADLALAALGGWVLARELGASRAGALVGMTATAFSPFFAGMLEFGVTEAWPVGWLALHAALLLRFGRTGRVADAVGAGAALGALLLAGWYHAAFALVAEVPLAAWALARAPAGKARLRVLAGVLAQGALATLPILPRLAETQAKASIWAPRLSGLTRPTAYTDWASNPRFGTDLLNFVVPRLDALDASRTVYLGLAVLALALVGASRRAGRVALLVALPLWVLALGHWLRVAGAPFTPFGALPAGILAGTFEVARGISHWHRAAGPATVFLAAAAALGASVLLGRARRATPGAVLIAGVVLADAVALSPVPWPRLTYAPDPPAELLTLPKPGALLQLPFDDGPGLRGLASRRVYDQWQVFHRRPVAEHYEGRDALVVDNALVAFWQGACGAVGPRRPAIPHLATDLARLRDLGVAYVVVHPPYAKPSCATTVGRNLGEPVTRTARAVVWDLAEAVARMEAPPAR